MANDEPARSHPEEMVASVRMRAGPVAFRAHARITPAGVICTAILVSAIILSIVPLVSASRRRVGQA